METLISKFGEAVGRRAFLRRLGRAGMWAGVVAGAALATGKAQAAKCNPGLRSELLPERA